jgi:hypothetical protein
MTKYGVDGLAKKDYDGDGKVESPSKEHAGAVHNAIQRKKGGVPDGQDTRGKTTKKKLKSHGLGEGFSNWRGDLCEIDGEIENKKQTQIKEKKVKNKIVINPPLNLETHIQNLGGELINITENIISDYNEIDIFSELNEHEISFLNDNLIDKILEEVFYEFIEEGYDIDEIVDILTENIDINVDILNEAKVTYGHDTKNETKTDRLGKVKSGIKRIGKALAKGAGYVSGAAVRGAKSAAKEFGSGYEKGRKRSSDSESSDSESRTRTRTRTSRSTPGLLSRIGTKLKSGLKKVVGKTARSVSRGARNIARSVGEEVEIDESMVSGPRKDKMLSLANHPRTTSRDRGNIHNIAVRNDTGPSYRKKSTGGKGSRFPGYGDIGAGNKAARRAGNEPMRGDTRKEEVELWVNSLIEEGYDLSDYTWDEMYEFYLDEGLGSAIRRIFSGKKKEEAPKPESRGAELRRRHNVGPERSETSAKRKILDRSQAQVKAAKKQVEIGNASKSYADTAKSAHDRYLKAGYSKYGADDARGRGNKARKRAAALNKEEFEYIVDALIEEGYDLSDYTWNEMYDVCLDEIWQLDEAIVDQPTPADDKVREKQNAAIKKQQMQNMKTIQRRKEQLERQKLKLQQQDKLPMHSNSYEPEGQVVDEAIKGLRPASERTKNAITPAQRKKQEQERKRKEELAHKARLVIAGMTKTAKSGEVTKSKQKSAAPESNRKLKPGQKKDTLAVKADKIISSSYKLGGPTISEGGEDVRKDTDREERYGASRSRGRGGVTRDSRGRVIMRNPKYRPSNDPRMGSDGKNDNDGQSEFWSRMQGGR